MSIMVDRSRETLSSYGESDTLLKSDQSIKHSIQDDQDISDMIDDLIVRKDHKQELKQGTSKAYGAVFIVINAAMGAGLLAFPYAFYLTGGWYWGVVTEMLILPFIIGGLVILAYCAELKQAATYEQIMEQMFGHWMRSVTELCVFIYCFGTCVTFIVVIGDQVEDITSAFKVSKEWWGSRKFTVPIATILLIYPWLYLKRIGILSYTSFIGVLACVYISIVVAVKYYYRFDSDCHSGTNKPSSSSSWATAFNAVPFVCFAFQCHISAVPIYAGLQKRTVKNFFFITVIGIFICTVVYSMTGVFGMLTFPGDLNSDILRNYCSKDIPVSIARGTLVLCLITSYPILFFCGRLSLDSAILSLYSSLEIAFARHHRKTKQPYKPSPCSSQSYCTPETIRRVIEINIWFVITLVLALFVPEIKYVISPLGCLAAVFIFVFPGLCILKLGLNCHFRSDWMNIIVVMVACIQMFIGVFIFGDSLVYNIMADFNKI